MNNKKIKEMFKISEEWLIVNGFALIKGFHELVKLAYDPIDADKKFNELSELCLPLNKFGIRKVNKVFKEIQEMVNLICKKNYPMDKHEQLDKYLEMVEIELLKHKFNIERINGEELIRLENYFIYRFWY